MADQLHGRCAVVTGSAHGIGKGIAIALAQHGARIALFDTDAHGAEQTRVRLAEVSTGPHVAVAGDVRQPTDVDGLKAQLDDAGIAVDILVNNVGDHRPWGPFVETREADWEAVDELNLRHVFRLTRAFLPDMVERGSGSIINVSSVEGLRGVPNCAVYAACKAAVLNFTASLATEVGHHGVRVNAIAPDMTETPQFPLHEMIAPKYHDQIPRWVPVGRFGRPDDHGDVAVFLASDAARFVTGQTIKVDGGTMASAGWVRRNDRLFTNVPRDFL